MKSIPGLIVIIGCLCLGFTGCSTTQSETTSTTTTTTHAETSGHPETANMAHSGYGSGGRGY